MKILISEEQARVPVTVFQLEGDIDSASYEELLAKVEEAHQPENDQAMKRGMMDGSYKSAHFKLLKPSSDVTYTLTTSGFDMFLEIYTDYKKALASF
jgi:hypothetical protein